MNSKIEVEKKNQPSYSFLQDQKKLCVCLPDGSELALCANEINPEANVNCA